MSRYRLLLLITVVLIPVLAGGCGRASDATDSTAPDVPLSDGDAALEVHLIESSESPTSECPTPMEAQPVGQLEATKAAENTEIR